MKLTSALILSAMITTPAVMAENTVQCPPSSVIANQTHFDHVKSQNGKMKVTASQPVVYNDVQFTITLSHNLTATDAQDALDTANDLLGSLSGPTKEHPGVFISIGEADFIPNVCQYQTPYGLTLLAKPDRGGNTLETILSGQ